MPTGIPTVYDNTHRESKILGTIFHSFFAVCIFLIMYLRFIEVEKSLSSNCMGMIMEKLYVYTYDN